MDSAIPLTGDLRVGEAWFGPRVLGRSPGARWSQHVSIGPLEAAGSYDRTVLHEARDPVEILEALASDGASRISSLDGRAERLAEFDRTVSALQIGTDVLIAAGVLDDVAGYRALQRLRDFVAEPLMSAGELERFTRHGEPSEDGLE